MNVIFACYESKTNSECNRLIKCPIILEFIANILFTNISLISLCIQILIENKIHL